jgi:signal transduction histidine kinase
LGQAQALVGELIVRVRDMSLLVRPAMLEYFGLLSAILWHSEHYTAQTRVRVTLVHAGLEKRFAAEVETAAYRIVQEALTNIARHTAVDEATVRLYIQGETLMGQIEDRGMSFNAEAALAAGHTSGLTGMHERARLLGGRLRVASAPGVGTSVQAELPLHPSDSRPPTIARYARYILKE